MSRVITFSRTFPSYHPKKGQPTYFVEQLCNSFLSLGYLIEEIDCLCMDNIGLGDSIKGIKSHTIRAGNRWKEGDKFSPRVWGGKPYTSPMIKIAEDITIKKIYKFELFYFHDEDVSDPISLFINDRFYCEVGSESWKEIAKNDGLTGGDLTDWFIKKNSKFIKSTSIFSGQIICWNEKIDY